MKNWIATNIIFETEEKLRHEQLNCKQRGSRFPTRKWNENVGVNGKSPRRFTLSKNFLKDVYSSLFTGNIPCVHFREAARNQVMKK